MKAQGNFSDYNVEIELAKKVNCIMVYKQVDRRLFIEGEIRDLVIDDNLSGGVITISHREKEVVLRK